VVLRISVQAVQLLEDPRLAPERPPLAELQLEEVGIESGLGEDTLHLRGEVAPLELAAGDVDRHPDGREPGTGTGCVRAGGVVRPAIQPARADFHPAHVRRLERGRLPHGGHPRRATQHRARAGAGHTRRDRDLRAAQPRVSQRARARRHEGVKGGSG